MKIFVWCWCNGSRIVPKGWAKSYEEAMSLPEARHKDYKLFELTEVKTKGVKNG